MIPNIVVAYKCCTKFWDIENNKFEESEDGVLFDIKEIQLLTFPSLRRSALSYYVSTQIQNSYWAIQLFNSYGAKELSIEDKTDIFDRPTIIKSFVALIQCLHKFNLISVGLTEDEQSDSQTSVDSNDTIDDEPDMLFMNSCRFTSLFIYCVESGNNINIMDNARISPWNYLNVDGNINKHHRPLTPGGQLGYAIQILIRYKNFGFQPWHTFIYYYLSVEKGYLLSSWRTGDENRELKIEEVAYTKLMQLLTIKKDPTTGLYQSTLKDPKCVEEIFGVPYGVQANQERLVRITLIN